MSLDSGGGLYVNVDSVQEWADVLGRSSGLAQSWRNLARDTDAFGTDAGLAAAWRLRGRNADALAAALSALEQVDAVFVSSSAKVAGAGTDYAHTDGESSAQITRTAGQPVPLQAGAPRPVVDPGVVPLSATGQGADGPPGDASVGDPAGRQDYAGLSFERLRGLVVRDDPEAVRTLSDRWSLLGDALYRQAETLGRVADGLAVTWRSPAGQAAVDQLRGHRRALEQAGDVAYVNRAALVGAADALADARRAMAELEHQLPRSVPEAIKRGLPLPDVLNGPPQADSRQPRAVAITTGLADAYDNQHAYITDPRVAATRTPRTVHDTTAAPAAGGGSHDGLLSTTADRYGSAPPAAESGPAGSTVNGNAGGLQGGGVPRAPGPVLAGAAAPPQVAVPPAAAPVPGPTGTTGGGGGVGPVLPGIAFPGRGGGVPRLTSPGAGHGLSGPAPPPRAGAPLTPGAGRGSAPMLPSGLSQPGMLPGTAAPGTAASGVGQQTPARRASSPAAAARRSTPARGPRPIGQRSGVSAYRGPDDDSWRPRPRSVDDGRLWTVDEEAPHRVIGARSAEVEDPNQINTPSRQGVLDDEPERLDIIDVDGTRVTVRSFDDR